LNHTCKDSLGILKCIFMVNAKIITISILILFHQGKLSFYIKSNLLEKLQVYFFIYGEEDSTEKKRKEAITTINSSPIFSGHSSPLGERIFVRSSSIVSTPI